MPIEFSCDRCDQKLKVPDDWGGRRVRCKGCNRVLKVPDPVTSQLDSSIDLAALKAGQEGPDDQIVTEFAPIPRASRSEAIRRRAMQDELAVTCPHCGKVIKVEDPYVEVLCSSCWKAVPPLKEGEQIAKASSRGSGAAAFYDEILSVFTYPIDAMGSILLGMLVAGGAILLPIGLVLMFVMGVALNPIAPEADISWVPVLLAAMFVFEGVYFAGMGYSGLLDAARNTVVESDKPPDLPWNLGTIGSGIVGYLTLLVAYALVFLGVNHLVSGGEFVVPKSLDDAKQIMSPVSIAALCLLTFTVPMTIIGLALMPGLGGMSPGRILRSIAGTIVHYLFLFAVVVFMLGIYLGIMSSVIGWAIDTLLIVIREGIEKGIGSLLMGLFAWTILIGAGLYCALMMGRLHGLFARTFRRKLAFD
ncbi:MAG: hypothetical protein JXQ73_05845 [Phycisphaerae bacterium]|nr:hypothetical protein [Phycisphaerae bacterium]